MWEYSCRCSQQTATRLTLPLSQVYSMWSTIHNWCYDLQWANQLLKGGRDLSFQFSQWLCMVLWHKGNALFPRLLDAGTILKDMASCNGSLALLGIGPMTLLTASNSYCAFVVVRIDLKATDRPGSLGRSMGCVSFLGEPLFGWLSRKAKTTTTILGVPSFRDNPRFCQTGTPHGDRHNLDPRDSSMHSGMHSDSV